MPFIVAKKTQHPPRPYAGPACAQAGVALGGVYHDRAGAEAVAARLTAVNAVGFDVWDLRDVPVPKYRLDLIGLDVTPDLDLKIRAAVRTVIAKERAKVLVSGLVQDGEARMFTDGNVQALVDWFAAEDEA